MNFTKRIVTYMILVFIFVFFASFGAKATLPPRLCYVTFDVESFSHLRQAITAEDDSGVAAFFESGKEDEDNTFSLSVLLPNRFLWGQKILTFLDQVNLLKFSNEENLIRETIRMEVRFVSDYPVEVSYRFSSGVEVRVCYLNRKNSDFSPKDPSFIWTLGSGESLVFESSESDSLVYYTETKLLSENVCIVYVSFPKEAKDVNAFIQEMGAVTIAPFSELTAAPPDNTWWHVALPVGGGIAVVGSLAAVLLLRKKKK